MIETIELCKPMTSGLFKNGTYNLLGYKSRIINIFMYVHDLALNNQMYSSESKSKTNN